MTKILLTVVCLLVLFISCNKNDLFKKNPDVDNQDLISGNICVSDEILQAEISTNSKRAKYLEDLEVKTQTYRGREIENARIAGKLYLPVVIHIVHIDPNIISDAQIKTQLDVWNNDFNKMNTELNNSSVYLAGYSYNSVANCQIEFYVSQIVRQATTVTAFDFYTDQRNDMKKTAAGGSDPIDPATKLNVWVSDNTPNGISWAQFPGGSLETDGIVIDYAFFGTNNPSYLGRVGTHEVGHWLNLRHIWGDNTCGNDFVKDTPDHNDKNTGCPLPGLKSTCSRKPLMMWMNYMDYSWGKCRYMFSTGQKNRMDAAIDNARKAYFSTIKLYPEIVF